MSRFTTLVVFMAFTGGGFCSGGPPAPLDPCDPANHVELNEPYRSTGFQVASPATPLCDIQMQMGWYRFTSVAGGMMPTSCQERFNCGTLVPMWMKGEHPLVSDGEVTREACGNFYSGGRQEDPCCDQSIEIKVRNCGQFYVYYLSPTSSCPVSYCAGDVPICPVGSWSPSLLPPCKGNSFPVMTTPPTLEGPIVSDTSFEFHCVINYEPQDEFQVFEVLWIFDGKVDSNILVQNVTDPSRVAILDGTLLQGHLDNIIQCKVRTYYDGSYQGPKSEFLVSNGYYAGLQISPPKLVLDEEVLSDTVSLTSTVPVVCDHQFQCCVTFQIDTDASNEISVPSSCFYTMCREDWDNKTNTATVEIPVVASRKIIQTTDKRVLMAFECTQVANGGPYMDVFVQSKPYVVPVEISQGETFSCTITGDPHIHSFDKIPFDLFDTGDYTVYEVPSRDFQVQIRTWPCNSGAPQPVTCICGVVIREKNDIIRIYECDQVYAGEKTSPTVDIAYPLREGTIIERSGHGGNIGVYLPSGTEVNIQAFSEVLNLFITGPSIDKGQARGLCGTNDGNANNEFTLPDGNVESLCASSQCIPRTFTNAWRVTASTSLFETIPRLVPEQDDVMYCDCTDGTDQVNCSVRGNARPSGYACGRCREILPNLNLWAPVFGERRKREVNYVDADEPEAPYTPTDVGHVNPDKAWPNDQGITEAQARDLCNKALEKSKLVSKCETINNMRGIYMTDCMADILFGETTQFLETITAAFTSECQLTLAKDPANYVTTPEGKQVLKPEYFDDICDPACDLHGTCGQKGVCDCDDGWEGINCHIQSGKGPQLDRIRSGPLCDRAQRPCQKVYIDVSNINLSDDLICRVQLVDDEGHNKSEPIDTTATFLTGYRIACSLPETTVASQRYKISASNDGSLFGNELSLHVFDSACLHCDETACQPKTTSCLIDKVCYENGTKYNGDKNKICDVSKSTTEWTIPNVCKKAQLADIIVVLDSSSSISSTDYQRQLKFVANLTGNFLLGPDDARFGAVISGSQSQILFNLKDYSDHPSLSSAIVAATHLKGSTETAQALNLVTNQGMFSPASGGRDGSTKIVIIIISGYSSSHFQALVAAQRLKNAGVQIIAIGFGRHVSLFELYGLASGLNNAFQVDSFRDLDQILNDVTKQICETPKGGMSLLVHLGLF